MKTITYKWKSQDGSDAEFVDTHPHLAFHLPGITPSDINRVLWEEYFSKDLRPLKLGELRPKKCQWNSILEGWVDEAPSATNVPVCAHHKGVRCHINTPISMPEVKAEPMVMVPLGPEDVPPGSVFRKPGVTCGYAIPSDVGEAGIAFPAIHGYYARTYDWSEVMELIEISRDGGKTWHPCSKPATKEGA